MFSEVLTEEVTPPSLRIVFGFVIRTNWSLTGVWPRVTARATCVFCDGYGFTISDAGAGRGKRWPFP